MTQGEAISNGSSGTGDRLGHKQSRDPIAVAWSETMRLPSAFIWRRRRYAVERVIEIWVTETGWWRDDGRVSRSYWRVRAEGRVFDLCYDRLSRTWTLERALN